MITNAAFTIERVLNAPPARVFAAFSSLDAKMAWFKAPADIVTLARDFDFRVGGNLLEQAGFNFTAGGIAGMEDATL